MLKLITAIRFDRRMTSGKTWPCLLAGVSTDGQEVEVVAKFSAGCERKVGGLVAEAIGAMLAADLDLPVPEPYLVEFDTDLANMLPGHEAELAARLRASVPMAFGLAKLPPGFAVLPKDKAIPQSLRAQAAEIFAFDALVQNPDRRPENPNCLLDGRSFAIFDHELAFLTEGVIGWQPPWKPGGLDIYKGTNRHIFFSSLQGKNLDFSRIEGAWRAISDARLCEYRQSLPITWSDGRATAENALSYIAQVRENIVSALAEVRRVLL